MGKNLDELGTLADFTAPWDDDDIDPVKAKKLLFNARSGKAAALDERDEARERIKAVESERDEFKKQAESTDDDAAQKALDKVTKERDDLKAKLDEREAADERAKLRAEVLGDFEAKHPNAAKYVTGETKEELEESLEQVREDFNLDDDSEDDDSDDDLDDDGVRTAPRALSLRNGGDRKNGQAGDTEYDFDKVAEQALARGGIFG